MRELISNAVTHRDYRANGTIQVRITPDELLVDSPGAFSNDTSWEKFLAGSSGSCPPNKALAKFMSRLLGIERVRHRF